MAIAGNLFENLVVKKQAGLGTKAVASGAQTVRRTTIDANLNRALFESAEILSSQQLRDARLGVKAGTGTISGEISPGTYSEYIASSLRGAFASSAAGGPESDVTVTASTSVITLTSAATATWITDGLRVGMVVRITGLAESGNNTNNILITSLTELVLIGQFVNSTTAVAEAAGSPFTVTEIGKSVTTPLTGHARDYYTVEKEYSDVTQSEQAVNTVFTGVVFGVTPDGMATIALPILYTSEDTSTSAYFTSPSAPTTSGIVAGPTGLLYINGVAQTAVTNVSDITVDGGFTVPGVVGSDESPDLLPGPLKATASMSALFEDATLRDLFLNETEVSILLVMPVDNTDTSDFVAIVLPRVKFSGADKSLDGNAIGQTLPVQCLENTSSLTGLPAGTVVYQDSLAP